MPLCTKDILLIIRLKWKAQLWVFSDVLLGNVAIYLAVLIFASIYSLLLSCFLSMDVFPHCMAFTSRCHRHLLLVNIKILYVLIAFSLWHCLPLQSKC